MRLNCLIGSAGRLIGIQCGAGRVDPLVSDRCRSTLSGLTQNETFF